MTNLNRSNQAALPRLTLPARKSQRCYQCFLPVLWLFLGVSLAACSMEGLPFLAETPASVPTSETPSSEAIPRAEVTFNLTVPPDTPPDDEIYISFLDEVTGLALNSLPGEMERVDETHFTTKTVAPIGSVLKYRYSRVGPLNHLEYQASSLPVRYRLYRVQGPGVVDDTVSRWQDTPYQWPTGRIQGLVTETGSGDPISNILVTAGGLHTVTASDGSFLLEGLPEGKHTLVAYAMDGRYGTFQQEAIVADGSTTPAPLTMPGLPLVDVTFNVRMPEGTPPGVPIKLAGNLSQFGNSFADLEGGMSSLPHRMPPLNALADGSFSLSIQLPAGIDLRYKYTLGDGFWNAEMNPNGSFALRQLIVPQESTVISDTVEAWQTGENAPVWFDVQVPENTPAGDNVSIQFNPYGWTEPLTMWRLGPNRWGYLLSSPLNLLDTIGYRYCRNDQCGIADDALTPGDQTGGRPLTMMPETQNLQDRVDAWENYTPIEGPVTVPREDIPGRGDGFMTGVEFSPYFNPTWESRLPQALATVAGLDSGWVVLTPTWSFTHNSPPVLEAVPGTDMLWDQLASTSERAIDSNLQVAFRMIPEFPYNPGDWWAAGVRDARWWDAWFERFQTFLVHHADLAEESGAEMLILGGPELAPALTGGLLGDGSPSGVPMDADSRWIRMISEMRERFAGEIGWALEMTDALEPPPSFLDSLDFVYVLWSAPLSSDPTAGGAALTAEAGRLLDSELRPRLAEFEGDVILAIAYPSATGGVTGCLTDPVEGDCLLETEIFGPNPEFHNLELNTAEQVEAYNAVLSAASDREWISGIVSRGFFPPVELIDTSISIHGKPASDLLSYWYSHLTGQP